MIKTFRCAETQKLHEAQRSRQFVNIESAARRKLQMIDAAGDVKDLRIPPGNRLEALEGNRKGQYSIRINDQWRICFVWRDGNAYEVEITDYH